MVASPELNDGYGDEYIAMGIWALQEYANAAGADSWEIVEQVDSVADLKRRDEAAQMLNKSILLNYPFEDRRFFH